ncbi:MAG: zinc ribbon domain-containing protein [Acidobacteria bacterium]|nr:zinc ribbon domain-containing protein [Acidobacteriota bacterium]
MAEVARNYDESGEYWKPVTAERRNTASDVCQACGTDYPLGARFCYVCGAERTSSGRSRNFSRFLDIAVLRSALGLPTLSLVAFFAGIACMIAACLVGFIYSATTLIDWQAVQLWRVEWLLAGIAAFLLGNLLKNSSKV